jgi:hypothetical protein
VTKQKHTSHDSNGLVALIGTEIVLTASKFGKISISCYLNIATEAENSKYDHRNFYDNFVVLPDTQFVRPSRPAPYTYKFWTSLHEVHEKNLQKEGALKFRYAFPRCNATVPYSSWNSGQKNSLLSSISIYLHPRRVALWYYKLLFLIISSPLLSIMLI